MKATLQYSLDDATFKTLGPVVYRNDKAFRLEPLTVQDSNAIERLAGYQVIVTSVAKELGPDFLSASIWFFRLAFFQEGKMIKLGLREYTVEYDAQPQLVGFESHRVEVRFKIKYSDYSSYAIPVNLPEGEGGPIPDFGNIYLE